MNQTLRSVSNAELLQKQLADPAFRSEWERTALARAVALQLVRYRSDHQLTQAQLARELGVRRETVSRWEEGEQTPKITSLLLLSGKLGIKLLLYIAPEGSGAGWLSPSAQDAPTLERISEPDTGSTVLVVAQ